MDTEIKPEWEKIADLHAENERLNKQIELIKKFLNSKMLNTKGENTDVASHRGGYNERIQEEWKLAEELGLSTD